MKNCYKNIKTYVGILKSQFSLLFFDVFESSLNVSCDDKLCPFLPSLTLTLNLTILPSLPSSHSLLLSDWIKWQRIHFSHYLMMRLNTCLLNFYMATNDNKNAILCGNRVFELTNHTHNHTHIPFSKFGDFFFLNQFSCFYPGDVCDR